MTVFNDYIGRKVDVLAFQGPVPVGEVLLTQSLALEGTGGMVTTGINFLAQRFLIELLTERGSIPHWPIRGTTFMTEIRSQFVRTLEIYSEPPDVIRFKTKRFTDDYSSI